MEKRRFCQVEKYNERFYRLNQIISNETLKLLEACDELNIDELIEDLQNYLIVEKKEWIEQNLVYIHKISSHHQLFNVLHNYCSEIINKNPEPFLKSNDFTTIEKSMLMAILKRDN